MRGGLDGRHVLMVVAPSGFRDEELFEPRAVFEDAGAVVEVASTTAGTARGMLGAEVEPDLTLEAVDPHRYAAIVLVGGTGAPAHLWENGRLHAILRLAHANGTTLAAICLAPVALARAGLLRGVRATVFGDARAKHELVRGSALYVDDDIIVDHGLVTASGPHAARAFADAVVRAVLARETARQEAR